MPHIRVPQSVALRVPLKAYLSSDHLSDAAGKTIAVTISKNGGAFGNPSVGATNATEIGNGWYYVDLSTTDTGTKGPLIIRGAVSSIDNTECVFEVADAHNMGFDGVPSATAGASTGLPLSVDSSGRVDVLKINGTSQTARDLGASVLLSSGTGTGQLDFTSGVVKANLAQILGTALTETAGQLAGAFKKLFDVAAPTLTCLDINQTGDSFARIGSAGAGLTSLGDTRVAHLDADVSSRLAPAGTLATVTNLTNAPTSGDFTATMKTSLNAATPAVTVSDKTGFALTAAYDPAKTASQAGDAMALTSGERTTLAGVVWASASRTLTSFGTLVADVTTAVWAAATRTLSAFAFNVNLDAAYDAAKTAAQAGNAMTLTGAYDPAKTAAQAGDAMALTSGERTTLTAAIWNALTSGMTTAGSIGKKLADWTIGTAQTGDAFARLGAPAGASVSADMAGVKSDSVAIKAKTDNLPAAPAATGDIPTSAQNADALLKRDMAALSGEAARSPLNALRSLRNRVVNGSGTLTVYKEDDSTPAFTAAVTTTSSADPITEIDPA